MHTHTAQTATSTTQVDDANIRINHWNFAVGEATGWHVHEYPYAVVPLVDGHLRIVSKEGETIVPLMAGQSYARPAGVEHDVINHGPGRMAFVEIEIKG